MFRNWVFVVYRVKVEGLIGGRLLRRLGSYAQSDINDDGQIVGGYRDAQGLFHGFLFKRGRFFTVVVPFPNSRTTVQGSTKKARSLARMAKATAPTVKDLLPHRSRRLKMPKGRNLDSTTTSSSGTKSDPSRQP